MTFLRCARRRDWLEKQPSSPCGSPKNNNKTTSPCIFYWAFSRDQRKQKFNQKIDNNETKLFFLGVRRRRHERSPSSNETFSRNLGRGRKKSKQHRKNENATTRNHLFCRVPRLFRLLQRAKMHEKKHVFFLKKRNFSFFRYFLSFFHPQHHFSP